MAARESGCDSVCPIARALSMVGDRWTLLIMRELALGTSRFDELTAQTGISPHLLSSRLQRLVAEGIVEKVLYGPHSNRFEYRATEKGRDLDPVLMALRSWERRWIGDLPPGQPAVSFFDRTTKKEIEHASHFKKGAENFRFAEVECKVGPAFAAERAARAEQFQETSRESREPSKRALKAATASKTGKRVATAKKARPAVKKSSATARATAKGQAKTAARKRA